MSGHQHHILVVDDDDVFAQTLGMVLRADGFRATTATHFDAALEALEDTDEVDLLLTDIVMPGSVNGLALSRMARMRHKDLPVIYLTGFDLPGVDREALGPILRKPVKNEALITAIRDALASPLSHKSADAQAPA